MAYKPFSVAGLGEKPRGPGVLHLVQLTVAAICAGQKTNPRVVFE